jgi:hypothetical protein
MFWSFLRQKVSGGFEFPISELWLNLQATDPAINSDAIIRAKTGIPGPRSKRDIQRFACGWPLCGGPDP